MARSDHSNRPRRAPRVDREGAIRTQTRVALRLGHWDQLEPRLTSRSLRRPADI